jgi:hypothetical protein
MRTTNTEAGLYLLHLGYETQSTGGGCWCYERREIIDGALHWRVITDVDGAALPAAMADPVMCCLYLAEEGVWGNSEAIETYEGPLAGLPGAAASPTAAAAMKAEALAAETSHVGKLLVALGFRFDHMGGNCTAWNRNEERNGQNWLRSIFYEGSAPTVLHDHADSALYRIDADGQITDDISEEINGPLLDVITTLVARDRTEPKPEPRIRSIADTWLDTVVARLGLGFHPDTRADAYVDAYGQQSLGLAEIAAYEEGLDLLSARVDVYAAGVDAFRRAGLLEPEQPQPSLWVVCRPALDEDGEQVVGGLVETRGYRDKATAEAALEELRKEFAAEPDDAAWRVIGLVEG